jgi:hypothetical protein
MTSAVLQFHEVNNPFKNEIMAPSDVSESPRARHGRGKHGGSVSKGGRTRASTLVNERQNLIAKALTWILKRGADSEDLKFDDEGFAECEELVSDWISSCISICKSLFILSYIFVLIILIFKCILLITYFAAVTCALFASTLLDS